MKIRNCVVMILCVCLLVSCSNRKLKPAKKSPCACYDVIVDMEKKV